MVKKVDEEKTQWGRVKNRLKMGIVGLPNVGKSSCFNLLTNLQIPALNYPFCTKEPNLAQVEVKDPRFDKLCQIYEPKSQVPAYLEIYDIAGLVSGAHLGQGLGNEFLSNIQSVDGIYHMVRAFSDPDIVHVEGDVNPIRDI
jgi:obg-like ATPase 1